MYIETDRLVLRLHDSADFEDYFAYIMDPELQRMLGLHDVTDRTSAQEMFQWLIEHSQFVALVRKDDGKVIGHISIQPPPKKVADAPEFKDQKGASLSFAIAEGEQRKGLMLEALQGLTGHMLREGAVDYFDCEYELSNVASRELQKRLGFQYWGKERFGDEEIVINILQNPG